MPVSLGTCISLSVFIAANGLLLLLGSEVDAWAGNCNMVGPLSGRLV